MSIYSITLNDVLKEWWNENPNDRYFMDKSLYTSFGRILCKTCRVVWIQVRNNKFEYALEPNKEQYYLEPGDPQLFEKLSWVLNTLKHDPFYKCASE